MVRVRSWHVVVTVSVLTILVTASLLWPLECVVLPSDPPQGPYCTSALGLLTTEVRAAIGGLITGVLAALGSVSALKRTGVDGNRKR